MKYLNKCKRYVLISSLMILMLLVFTACGAEINTEMNFDKNFKGERIITAFISSSDLNSYVSTGADGIEDVIKRYIPESLSYKRVDKELGDVEFIFTINFDNLEDYTKKITQILSENPDNTIQATILYDNKNNEFKNNIVFEENFSSNDLLAWLTYGLKTENVVNYSSVSQWTEEGKALLKIENQDYDVFGNFKVNKSESTSFDKINVMTEILQNKKLKRSITFIMNEKNVKILSGKGLAVAEYLKNLSPKNAGFEEIKEENNIKYIISFESETSQELSSNTDKIFNSQDSVFTINYSSYENSKNVVRIDLEEYIDASYYLNYDSNRLESNIHLYENMSLDFNNTNNNIYINQLDNRAVFSYNPNFYDIYKFTFSLPVQFKNVSLNIDVNKNKILEKLAMSVSGNLPDSLTEIIEKNIKSSIASDKINADVKKEENSTTYTLSLNDTPDEVSNEFKNFLSNYTGNNISHEISYTEVKSKSVFKTAHSLSVVVDLPKLNAENVDFYCKPSSSRKFEILESSNIAKLENSTNKSVASKVNGGIIRFYALETGMKIVSIIISVLSVIILAIIILYIISKRERIKLFFKNMNKDQKVFTASSKGVVLAGTDEVELEQDEDEDEFI